VRELKHQAHHHALDQVQHQKAKQHLPPGQRHYCQGQGNEEQVVQGFVEEQIDVLAARVAGNVRADLGLKKLHVVFAEHPRERRQPVERKGLQVLVALPRPPWLLGRQANQARCYLNVLVVAGNVGVGMVHHVVGEVPHVGIGAHQVE